MAVGGTEEIEGEREGMFDFVKGGGRGDGREGVKGAQTWGRVGKRINSLFTFKIFA